MSSPAIHINRATLTDIPEILRLTREVFDGHVAPTYVEEGNNEFYKYISEDAFRERFDNNHFVLLARVGNETGLGGLIEFRNNDHVSLFFVRTALQGLGMGRRLFEEAVRVAKNNRPELKEISVNSSPNAVIAYQKLGFHITSAEKTSNGIRYTPMTVHI